MVRPASYNVITSSREECPCPPFDTPLHGTPGLNESVDEPEPPKATLRHQSHRYRNPHPVRASHTEYDYGPRMRLLRMFAGEVGRTNTEQLQAAEPDLETGNGIGEYLELEPGSAKTEKVENEWALKTRFRRFFSTGADTQNTPSSRYNPSMLPDSDPGAPSIDTRNQNEPRSREKRHLADGRRDHTLRQHRAFQTTNCSDGLQPAGTTCDWHVGRSQAESAHLFQCARGRWLLQDRAVVSQLPHTHRANATQMKHKVQLHDRDRTHNTVMTFSFMFLLLVVVATICCYCFKILRKTEKELKEEEAREKERLLAAAGAQRKTRAARRFTCPYYEY